MQKAGVVIGSGQAAMAASGEKTSFRFLISHSKNGRCMNLKCISELGGMRELDVGSGWGGQW